MANINTRDPGELYMEAMEILAENPLCRMCGELNGEVDEYGWCKYCREVWEESFDETPS